MIVKTKIVQGKYLDSVKLMLISKELRTQAGVQDAVAILATRENMEILSVTDMLVDEISSAGETDLVIVIKADTDEQATKAMAKAEALLNDTTSKASSGSSVARSLKTAVQALEGANLCLISVAGKYAAQEADQALEEGLHVMIFSDNVSLEDELSLKQKAVSKGLLLMGPDCGTAIINGCPLGFANRIPEGKIGIVSAAGTGLQEVSVTIAHLGFGVSQAFGTGGRDGKQAIGGIMLSACLDYLTQDADTEVIIMIAKTPDPEVRKMLWRQIENTAKPVIVCFLQPVEHPDLPNLHYCTSLEDSAHRACIEMSKLFGESAIANINPDISMPKLGATRDLLIGLYSGGTLCYEAQQLYHQYFARYPLSNTPLHPDNKAEDVWNCAGDCFIDLGSDEFTVGRPHPMIDYSLRMKMLEHMGNRDDVAVIILDVVLGYGAHPDPAEEILAVLSRVNSEIPIVCHVLGTRQDPQDAYMQAEKLRAAGLVVFTSHHAAADFAIRTLQSHRRIDE